MRIRRHLSYANVVATLALVLALGGGAYAINRVDSRQIVNGSIRSVDLKNGKAVHAADVKRNGLRGRQINEGTLNASRFAPIAGREAGDCNPSSAATYTPCAETKLVLSDAARIFAVATGNQESLGGAAKAFCEVRIDNEPSPLAVQPGEQASDNTSSLATNGFARTLVTPEPLPKGRHDISLACKELTGNVRIDVPTIAAIAISSG
ncbi:MAG: hypothetical protein ACRDLL_09490 [Solirubrobacterales bacterium]